MARGAHRNDGRGGRRAVAILSVILILGAVAAGAWFLFLREGAPISIAGEAEVPEFSFQLVRVKGDSPAGNIDGEGLMGEAEAVRETMDALYVAGYVDPAKWEGGTFPEALEQFDDSARRQAEKDLDQFTLGQDVQGIESVRPVNGRLEVKFLADSDQNPIGAVATALFAANATLKGGGPAAIQHDATYYLTPEDDRWLIIGYDVRGIVTPVDQPLPANGEATP
jgi:hypothetical protein